MNMIVDERASIKSILEALQQEGVKTADVAKQIPNISEKPFRQALKASGYIFSNKSPKGWHFEGEGPEPLEKSIFDFIVRSPRPQKKKSQTIHDEFTVDSHTHHKDMKKNVPSRKEETPNTPQEIHMPFTRSEIDTLRDIVTFWEKDSLKGKYESLHDRVKKLNREDKKRGTIVISKSIMSRLDAFCDKEDEDKSDIIHLALLDFLDKYEKED